MICLGLNSFGLKHRHLGFQLWHQIVYLLKKLRLQILFNGLRVPDDISLVGFDVQDKAQLISPSITTVRQPENLIGSRVGELLLRRLEEKDEEQRIPQQILLRPSIVVGQSVKKVN